MAWNHCGLSFFFQTRATSSPSLRSDSPSHAPRHLTEAAQSWACRGPNPAAVETGSPRPPTLRFGCNKDFLPWFFSQMLLNELSAHLFLQGSRQLNEATRVLQNKGVCKLPVNPHEKSGPSRSPRRLWHLGSFQLPPQTPGQRATTRLSSPTPSPCATRASKLSCQLYKSELSNPLLYKFL